MPTIYFTIGPETEKLAAAYLAEIKANPERAGSRLRAFLNDETMQDWFEKDLKDITVKQLISTLMSTKQPSGASETDWSPTELKILSNVSLHFLDASAYNAGTTVEHKDFPEPQHKHIAFISGATFTSELAPGRSYDTPELLSDGQLDREALFRHYEEKFMPIVLALNNAATERNEQLVLNIPDFSHQELTGPFEKQIQQALPKIIHQIIVKHATQLTALHTVCFDSLHAMALDAADRTVDIDAGLGRKIHFQVQSPQAGAETHSPLEFPHHITEDQIRAEHLVVAKLVDSSPISWPGKDIWANAHHTDESITFGATNALSKMLDAGTLVRRPMPEYQVKYNPDTGYEQFYKHDNGEDVFFEHQEMISALGLRFVGHSYNIFTQNYRVKPELSAGQHQAHAAHRFWSKDTASPPANDDPLKNTPK